MSPSGVHVGCVSHAAWPLSQSSWQSFGFSENGCDTWRGFLPSASTTKTAEWRL